VLLVRGRLILSLLIQRYAALLRIREKKDIFGSLAGPAKEIK